MSSSVVRRLKKELVNFRESPLDGCLIEANDEDLFNWQATIRGPEDTPYKGGNFLVNIHHPQDYPLHPPVYTFATKIYHPNVDSTSGLVKLRDLQPENWSPSMVVTQILLSLIVAMGEPDFECAVMSEMALECEKNPEAYRNAAKKWTEKHAME